MDTCRNPGGVEMCLLWSHPGLVPAAAGANPGLDDDAASRHLGEDN